MAEEDILQPIRDEDVPRLLDVLLQDMPRSTVAYHWIRVQRSWEKKIPGVKVHILCPRGDWRDGTVVAFTDGLAGEGRKYGVAYAREGSGDQELKDALLRTRVIPWHSMIHLSGVQEHHIDTVRTTAEAAGVKLAPQISLAHLLHFPAKIAALLEPVTLDDPDLRIARLSGADLDAVWSLRDFFPECMRPVIWATLEHNHSYGVFARRPDGSEQLVSVAAEMEHGGLGMGQTHPDYLRRGLNTAAGAHVMKNMGMEGKSPNGMTWITNEVVTQYLTERGFQILGRCNRVEIAPGKKSGRAKL